MTKQTTSENHSVIYNEGGVTRIWTTLPSREEAEAALREDRWCMPGEFFSHQVVRAADAARYANKRPEWKR